jgi:hypothetical protein
VARTTHVPTQVTCLSDGYDCPLVRQPDVEPQHCGSTWLEHHAAGPVGFGTAAASPLPAHQCFFFLFLYIYIFSPAFFLRGRHVVSWHSLKRGRARQARSANSAARLLNGRWAGPRNAVLRSIDRHACPHMLHPLHAGKDINSKQTNTNLHDTCWACGSAVVQAQRVHSTPSRACFCANECSCGSCCAHGTELPTSQRRARGWRHGRCHEVV